MIDLAMAALTALMVALVGAAVARHAPGLARRIVAGLLVWLAATAALAASGALSTWTAVPPRLPFLPLTMMVAFVLASRTQAMRALIGATPRAWPIAAQTFRIAVELLLYGLYADGRAPERITFEGRNLDILVGLSAPFVAVLVARRGATTLAIIWNVAGLAILANTIIAVLTSLPGPLHADGIPPFTAVASWPMVWLPAFLVPLAIALHVVSLQQARRAAVPRRG